MFFNLYLCDRRYIDIKIFLLYFFFLHTTAMRESATLRIWGISASVPAPAIPIIVVLHDICFRHPLHSSSCTYNSLTGVHIINSNFCTSIGTVHSPHARLSFLDLGFGILTWLELPGLALLYLIPYGYGYTDTSLITSTFFDDTLTLLRIRWHFLIKLKKIARLTRIIFFNQNKLHFFSNDITFYFIVHFMFQSFNFFRKWSVFWIFERFFLSCKRTYWVSKLCCDFVSHQKN